MFLCLLIRAAKTSYTAETLTDTNSNKSEKITKPMSEDDCPDDEIVSFPHFELEGDKIYLNYIREERRDFFRPLNAQIDSDKPKASDNESA